MRHIFLAIGFLLLANLHGQSGNSSAIEGTSTNKVTDIVVVFKMHVDIGYTNWAEGVLQKYSHEMLDETLKAIDQTASLPESKQFVWTIPASVCSLAATKA